MEAEGSAIAYGEILTKDFLPEDFPEGADLSGFYADGFVFLEDGDKIQAGDRISLPAEYGKTDSFLLTGNSGDGFILTKT
ncbi:MAG TPA: hypothetical protein PKY19_05950 [Oscillospiraceae bacterium]|nr:hypothetical protein [Oscillospiraceae bacterium]HXK78004.1 hypothetical protein [Oscillospiraceae bacterium]